MLIRLLKDCRGGIAPLMGLLALPLMGAVGVAIDFSRANATRTAFQASLDSTALMLSKSASQTPTPSNAALTTEATNTFTALFAHPEASNVTISAVYSPTNGSRVTVTGSATIATNFLGLLGYDHLNITAQSVSTWGNTRLRVALVLDNTLSMLEKGSSQTSKMDALKTASHNLLTQLQTAAANNPDNVYVSIIPFNKDVNVGSSNSAESWLYWDDGVTTADNYWDALNGSCNRGGSAFTTRSKCLAVNVCSKPQKTTQSTCTSNNGTWYTTPGTWTHAEHSTWNGCVIDRDQNFDTTNDAPGSGGTLYPTEQYASCPASVLQLTNNWNNLSARVDDMVAAGYTNQAIGLQMGWQTLTASPFTVPAIDRNYNYQQVIILLTDGLNTEDRWYNCPVHGPCPTIDGRQQLTCDNIKATGITIYAVQVETGSNPTPSPLLQSCASDSSKFFLLTSSDAIVATFNQIGTAISKLRLAM